MADVNPQPRLIRYRGPLNRPEYILAWHLILRDELRGMPAWVAPRGRDARIGECWLPLWPPSILKRCRRCGRAYFGRDLPAAVCRAAGVD